MALTGNLKASVQLSHTLAGIDLTTPSEGITETATKTVSSGRVYHDQKALTASQVYNLDVSDSSLSDVFGNTIAMTVVAGLYIKADDANTGDIQVTTGVNSWTGTLPALSAGESILLACNIDVSTNTELYITDDGNAGTFEIIITGTE